MTIAMRTPVTFIDRTINYGRRRIPGIEYVGETLIVFSRLLAPQATPRIVVTRNMHVGIELPRMSSDPNTYALFLIVAGQRILLRYEA